MEEMSDKDFLKMLNAYTTIQHLLGVIEGASCGIENVGIADVVGNSASQIGKILDDVFCVIQVIDEDGEED